MVITGNAEREVSDLKEKPFLEFEMKDLGNLKYFLGIEVLRSKRGIFMNQKKYVLDLWQKLECSIVNLLKHPFKPIMGFRPQRMRN